MNSNYIKFDLSTQTNLLDRTNNIVEGFNNSFNKYIEIYKSSLSHFIEKIKSITIKNFNLIVESMVNNNDNIENYNSIYNQIYNFLYNIIVNIKVICILIIYCN